MNPYFRAFDAGHAAFRPLLDRGLPAAIVTQALAFYDEPHRCYHDRRHLQEMFDAADALGFALSPAQILAVLFHDAVYVPGAPPGMNETMSAQLLRVYAGRLDPDSVERACAIVMDTVDHAPGSDEAQLVLDLDLMRLSAGPAEFERYSRQVFEEQRPLIDVTDDGEAWGRFVARRRAFFERLLARPAIYSVAAFRDRFEALARTNLRQAVAQQDAGRLPLHVG
jgi:predicted metal-dependent HD superfamily phosphohydrolase